MVGTNYETEPVGHIVNKGADKVIRNEKILTSEGIKSGMLVTIDENDYKAKLPTSATDVVCGWVGFEQTHYAVRPNTFDDTYAVGDVATILTGSGFEIYALITGSNADEVTVKIGDKLVSKGDGTLTVGTENAVAIAMESMTIAHQVTPAVKRIHVQSLI